MKIFVAILVMFLLIAGGIGYLFWSERSPTNDLSSFSEGAKERAMNSTTTNGGSQVSTEGSLAPTEEVKAKTYSPPPRTTVSSSEKPPSNHTLNRIKWAYTPEEQGIKVGDWIKVKGWTNAFVGASFDVQENVLRYSGDKGHIFITPMQDKDHSKYHRIIGIAATVSDPYGNEDVRPLNNMLLQTKNVSHWGAKAQVLVTAKVTLINKEPDYPNAWSLICSGANARVLYYPYSN